jgi:hypothetical protein
VEGLQIKSGRKTPSPVPRKSLNNNALTPEYKKSILKESPSNPATNTRNISTLAKLPSQEQINHNNNVYPFNSKEVISIPSEFTIKENSSTSSNIKVVFC